MNIAVTQSEYFQKDRNQMLDCLDQRLVCFLQNFGVSIYPIPNSLTLDNHLHKWVKNAEVDAIVLSGGGNVGEASGRDHIERILIKLAIQRSIPPYRDMSRNAGHHSLLWWLSCSKIWPRQKQASVCI